MCKLCGGTFLVLLINYGKDFNGSDFLCDMLKIFDPKVYIDKKYLKEQTKKFKTCKEHSSLATPFEDASRQKMINEEIENNYGVLLKRAKKYIEKFIDISSNTKKDQLLVKTILEVIKRDKSISNEQVFYILTNGKSVKKDKLLSMKEFYLPSFLLGIMHYVIINIKDNKQGADTYNKWCPQAKNNAERVYTANIGENSSIKIKLITEPKIDNEIHKITPKTSNRKKQDFNDNEKYQGDIIIEFPESSNHYDYNTIQQYFPYLPLSESDTDLLNEFYTAYDSLIINCIKTDFANSHIDPNIPELIAALYNKWELKSLNFADIELRKYVFEIIKTLNMLEEFLSPEYVFISEDGNYLRMIHDTFEDDERNEDIFIPATKHIRLHLRNLFVLTHHKQYFDQVPFEEHFDDWIDGQT